MVFSDAFSLSAASKNIHVTHRLIAVEDYWAFIQPLL